ncbi:MAG: RES domain-containing protein [Sulfurospirillum sp.]|nr:RES domain-containing protein [Sulfurospirillum sp.]
MKICEFCFESDIICNFIKEKGVKLSAYKTCERCKGEESLYRLNKLELKEAAQNSIRKFYEHEFEHGLVQSASSWGDKGDDIGTLLPDLMSLKDICYELFELDTINNDFYELLKDSATDDASEFDDCPDSELWLDMRCNWEGSARIFFNWDTFCENVKHKARFFDYLNYSRKKELENLKETFETLSATMSCILYRGRSADKTNLEEIKINPSKKLGIVPPKNAKNNRFSPVGISYVYLSSDKETVIKEIRAIQNSKVAMGKFKINKLELIDLREITIQKIKKNPFSEKLTSELSCSFKVIKKFINDISKEINKKDQPLDYVPTQIVSEYIWSLGYQGFIFDSSLCNGDNYVLFNDSYEYDSYEIIDIDNTLAENNQ